MVAEPGQLAAAMAAASSASPTPFAELPTEQQVSMLQQKSQELSGRIYSIGAATPEQIEGESILQLITGFIDILLTFSINIIRFLIRVEILFEFRCKSGNGDGFMML